MDMAVDTILPFVVVSGSIASILFSIEAGYHTGARRLARNPNGPLRISPTVEAAIFGLMGLLITFIFWGAGTRFDNRRNLIVKEANAVATAYRGSTCCLRRRSPQFGKTSERMPGRGSRQIRKRPIPRRS
jgi:hypothetical protein